MSRVGVLALLLGSSIAGTAAAQPAPPDVNDVEFKCMYAAAKAESKFGVAKIKCVSKCFNLFWKGIGLEEDCVAPYGGVTAACISNPPLLRGAEDKFEYYLRRYCDTPARGTDCPECYNGGDCNTMAGDRVQERENQIDAFVPALFCETAGALPEEKRCQLQTAKTFARYYASATKCYAKCFADARSNGTPLEECLPPVTNGRANGCLTSARAKSSATIHKYCHDTSTPAATPECSPAYRDGDEWVAVTDLVVENQMLPSTFCSSPSGAFVDD